MTEAAVYGSNAGYYPDQPAVVGHPPPDTVTVNAATCGSTRPELQRLLEKADFGGRAAAYNAYFRSDPADVGGHVCRSCGFSIGMHGTGDR
jgi:hypothetical protein